MVVVQDSPVLSFAPSMDKSASSHRLQRLKRLDRPNKSVLDEQIATIHQQIDGLQDRIFEINTIIDNKQQNKHVASQELLDARNRLSDLNSTFRLEVDKKRALREELDLADKMSERTKADARSLREKLPYVRVDQIDEEIRKLEYRMSHCSLSLQEEKRLLFQIEGFKKSRQFVRDYNERMDRISHNEGSRAELLGKIKESDQRLNALKAQQEEQRMILAEIREKEAAQALDIPALIQERSNNIDKIKTLREEVKELKAEFRVKEDEFWEREREWKAQQALERKLKAEKKQAEWNEREKVRRQRAMENFVEPFTDEILLCEQLISYMQKIAPVEDVHAAVDHKVDIIIPKGFGDVMTGKKNRIDDDLEGWLGRLGCKGKIRKAKAPTATRSKEKERLSLSLDALTSFEKVTVSPPTTIGDVSKSVEDLKTKKENFLQLQKQAREGSENENIQSQAVATESSSGDALETKKSSENNLKGKTVQTEEPAAEIESSKFRTPEAASDFKVEEEAISQLTEGKIVPENGIAVPAKSDPETFQSEEGRTKLCLDTSSTAI